jgi:hypothetical protein
LARAQTLNSEAIARVAQAITVRIEGATQGSGVLVKRVGNRYTVLTAWHVVSGQRLEEELAIYTPDGRSHQVVAGSIQRVGQVDMATINFNSLSNYNVASIGSMDTLRVGGEIYVSGMPISTSAVPVRIFRFLGGRVIANAGTSLPNGFQLLYSNQTLPGMSGGAVLNANGQLIGIHGQGETDALMTEIKGVAVKTGTNQGIPVSYYQLPADTPSVFATPPALSTPRSQNMTPDVNAPQAFTPSKADCLPAASLRCRLEALEQIGSGVATPARRGIPSSDINSSLLDRYNEAIRSHQEIMRGPIRR